MKPVDRRLSPVPVVSLQEVVGELCGQLDTVEELRRGEDELEDGQAWEVEAKVEELSGKVELEAKCDTVEDVLRRKGDSVETVTKSGKEFSTDSMLVDDDVTKLEDEENWVGWLWLVDNRLDALVRISASVEPAKSTFDRVEDAGKS